MVSGSVNRRGVALMSSAHVVDDIIVWWHPAVAGGRERAIEMLRKVPT